MSRHYFKTTYTGKPIEVLMGFDRPLNGFFMVIDYQEEPEDDDEGEGLIYSNLWERNPHPDSLTPYLEKLTELNISVPAEMLQEIEKDGEVKMGNKNVRHAMVDGTYTRTFIG
ncbi:hypothetical protein [Cellvibrio sp. QJXJ]|uniref:hypothetical protein n=1 Tax=Cellvibrio sp. QJXJ TaxID=2964606 RepID=UPI0021C2C534|nr:hypothetical protein [Cellvibrio sp. QJXJ]UUA74247.1 hypothetical protein NNX04_07350 [Cellvibrio sp. QJXJ]